MTGELLNSVLCSVAAREALPAVRDTAYDITRSLSGHPHAHIARYLNRPSA